MKCGRIRLIPSPDRVQKREVMTTAVMAEARNEENSNDTANTTPAPRETGEERPKHSHAIPMMMGMRPSVGRMRRAEDLAKNNQ